jgi:predicted PurR-regulated permease PerM
VLVSVIVGGALFGVWGILLSVPVAAVIKLLIKKYIMSGKRHKKDDNMEKETETGDGNEEKK